MSNYNTSRFGYPQNANYHNESSVNFYNRNDTRKISNFHQEYQQDIHNNNNKNQQGESKYFTKMQPQEFQPRNLQTNIQQFQPKPTGNIFKLPTPRPRLLPQELNPNSSIHSVQNTTMNMNSTLNNTLNTSLNESFSIREKSFQNIGNVNNFERGRILNTETEMAMYQRKKAEEETIRYLTGNIEKVLQFNKILRDFCHYEVIGPMISLQEGSVRLQKVLLLRDKTGPVLKVVHYVHDRINLPNFFMGQIIRCVGRMIGPNTLQAVHIREATGAEIETLPRISYVSEQEVNRHFHYLN